jgi:acetyltransferase
LRPLGGGDLRLGGGPARPYPRELEQIVTAPDGRRLLLRPVRPEDQDAFRANFSKFSAEAVRRRFFGPLKSLTRAAAAKLTRIDYDREMAFVLTDVVPAEDGSPEGYGVARIVIDAQGRSAEFALIVRDDVAGNGWGTLLMQRLISYARDRGVREIIGDVLPDNTRMLALCRSLGFVIEPGPQGRDPVRVRLRLDHAAEMSLPSVS